jgi:hypothetical protein
MPQTEDRDFLSAGDQLAKRWASERRTDRLKQRRARVGDRRPRHRLDDRRPLAREVAVIDEGAVTRRILQHLGLPAEVPPARPPRPPPTAGPQARHFRSGDLSWSA